MSAAIDWKSILEAAYEAREECPELFMLLLEEQFVPDGWHDRVEGKNPWHASALSKCTRALMYRELGVEEEPTRPDTNVTFDVGKFYHCLFQFGLAVHPDYILVGHELGGIHGSGDLAARADAVFSVDGQLVLIDIKSEKPGASKNRHSDAVRRSKAGEDGGKYSAARPDHCVQIEATSEVLKSTHNLVVDEAWAVYVDRGWLTIDPQPVNPRPQPSTLIRRVLDLDFARDTLPALPNPYPKEHWNCRELTVEGQKMGVGKYCNFWSYCRNGRPLHD
jgi:hypothetical protein